MQFIERVVSLLFAVELKVDQAQVIEALHTVRLHTNWWKKEREEQAGKKEKCAKSKKKREAQVGEKEKCTKEVRKKKMNR